MLFGLASCGTANGVLDLTAPIKKTHTTVPHERGITDYSKTLGEAIIIRALLIFIYFTCLNLKFGLEATETKEI